MECRFCGSVLCVAFEHILLPPLLLLHSDLVLGQQWLPPSRHAVDLLCCVCANMNGVPLQKFVKIANDFFLYFAILMGVRVYSSCLRTVRLQIVASLVPWNSKAVESAPDQTATIPETPLVRLLAVLVGVVVGVVGSRWLYTCMFLWTLMSV